MQAFKKFWIQVFKVAGKKDLFFSASAITFNLLICSIPFTLILVAIIGYVLSYDQAFNYIVQLGSDYLPAFAFQPESSDVISGSGTVEELIRPLVGARQVFGIIGFIILVFFTQGLLHSLKHVLFDVFDIVERKHPIVDIIYNFFGFGLIGAVFLFFSLAISMFSFVNFSQIYVPFTDIVIQLPWIYDFLNLLIPVVFIFMLLYIVFRFLSERKISPKVALIGALSYTILFEAARFIISNYLEYAFSTYRYFYQGYAIAFVIVLWTFYTSLLFVVSVILARAYHDVYSSHRPTFEDNPYSLLD